MWFVGCTVFDGHLSSHQWSMITMENKHAVGRKRKTERKCAEKCVILRSTCLQKKKRHNVCERQDPAGEDAYVFACKRSLWRVKHDRFLQCTVVQ